MSAEDGDLRVPPERPAPPPGPELRALIDSAVPVRPRRPRRDLGTVLAASLAVGGALLVLLGVRGDAGALPRFYLIAVAALWAFGLTWLAAIALAPPPGSMMPRWRVAGLGAAVVASSFVVVGLTWTESSPGWSLAYPAGMSTAAAALRFAPACLGIGVTAAAIPLALGLRLVRRSAPAGAEWIGAALGAAGGCLGGLVLHLHCAIAEPSHVGLVHGGVVFVGAALGAVLGPRIARP